MWWLTLCFSLPLYASTAAQNSYVDTELFQQMLERAAYDVIGQHTDEMSRLKPPPDFEMPSDFMRSFTPKTGVGNREELVINRINQIPVYEDANLSHYRYRRFNNTDYVLGRSENRVMLNIMQDFQEQFFAFSASDSILNFVRDYPSTVKDVTTFTRLVKNAEYFYVAVLTESQKTSQIHTYEVVGYKAVLVAVIDLGMSASTGSSVAIKISHVQSQFGGSLVVLIKSFDVNKIVYRLHGSSELTHYIEVHYPYAMDFKTFSIHGSGYVAVSSHNMVEIYKMDQFAQAHQLFDRMNFPMGGLTDLEYFRLGFSHYLVVAGDIEQRLYSWSPAEFSLKQIFPTTGAKQAYSAVLASCRDDVLLLFIGDKIDLYFYSGSREDFISVQSVFPSSFIVQPGSMTSFAYKSKVVLLFSDLQSKMQALIVETSLNAVEDPVLSAGKKMEELMKNIKARIDSQAEQVKTIKEVLSNAVRSTGNQVITAFQTFDQIVAADGIEINEINEPIFVEWEGSNLTMEEYKKGTEQLEKEVEELEKYISEIERIIPDVVRVDQPSVVTGRKVFSGDIKGPSLNTVSLNLDSAAGINLKEIQKHLYRLDKPNQIKGTLFFEQPLTVLGNLDVDGTVNGIDISQDVMTTNTKQTSTAEMTFLNKLTIDGNLDIDGKLNEIDIGKEVVTLTGNHRITGTKSFLNGIFADKIETKLLDGIDIDYLKANALTVSGNQYVPGLKTFTGGIVTNNITLRGTINGFNITELANSVVRIDKSSEITGHKTFTNDVIIEGDLMVDGKINGLKLPDDLFLTDETQVITGPKTFLGTVTAHDVSVTGTIDGLNIPDDIVTLSKDETVSSTLYFTDGISVEKDIIVENLVDEVDISELAKEALKVNETNEFNNAVFFGPVTINGDLDVMGLVNKVNLKETIQDIVYKDEFPIVIKSKKYFQQVKADSVKVQHSINGYNIERDFMRVHGDQVINGTKIFKKPVVFNTVFIENDAISGINISRLYEDQITLAIQDQIDNDIEFADDVIVEGNLIVHGTVNGITIPNDVVLKNSRAYQLIENKVFEKYVKVDNLIVDGDMNVSGMFGNIDLMKFYRNRITLTGDQEIDGDLWLSNATASKVWISGLVNGINFSEFASNVMSKTKDQTITAQKTFSGRTTVYGPITTEKGVNNVNIAELKRRAFKLHEDNVVTAPLEFSDITIGNLMVTENINGVNLTRLYHDSLKKYDSAGPQYVTGITVFEAGFHVDEDIMADTVNDLVLTRDVLLKSIPQDITGSFTLGSVSIGGNLDVKGLINGMDLSEMAPLLARTDQEYTVESNITFTSPVKVLQNVEVSGLVNGVDLKKLLDNVLLKNGDQFIAGSKTLRGNITIRGDLGVETINGVNWSRFLEDLVFIDKPQKFTVPKSFTDVEVSGDVFVAGSAQIGTINGQDLSKFIDDVVFTDVAANITGPIVFKEAVEIAGNMDAMLINGLRLKTDVITITCNNDGPQLITGRKTFQNLHVSGDIIVESVNSYDLQNLYLDTLLIDGNQNVTGRKIMTSDVTFQANVYPNTVNGMYLRNELVTLNTDQEVTGPLTFEDDVFIQKDIYIDGLLNGIDLKQLEKDAVYLDKEQVIDGSFTIQNAIVHSDVSVQGLVNGLDLVALDRNITEFWNHAAESITEMEKHSEDSCELAKYLQDYLKKTYLVLDGFVTHQKIEYSAKFLRVSSPQEINLIYVKDSNEPSYAIKSTWDANSKRFLSSSPEETAVARTIDLLDKVEIKIHIGVFSKDSFVTLNGATDRLPRGFKDCSSLKKDDQVIIAFLFPADGLCDIYKITGLSASYLNPFVENYGSIKVGIEATSISMFEVSGAIYMAVSSLHSPPYRKASSQIYARTNDNWSRLQNIGAPSSPFVKYFLYHNYHYLAFINNAPVYETREPKSIQIYRNSGPNEMLFTLFQKIPFDDAKGIEIFQFGDLSDLYLTTWNDTVIKVFRLEGEAGMTRSITLYGNCIQDVKPLIIDSEIYLAVGQQNLKTNDVMPSVIFKGMLKGSLYMQHNLTYC